MDLEGKKILITGGTSGLGLEIACSLVSGGAHVYAMGRTLKGSFPDSGNYTFVPTDFTDLDMVERSLDKLHGEKIIFDFVINNAGVLTTGEYLQTRDGFEYSFQINFLTHLFINEIVVRNITERERLVIMVMTSPVYKYCRPDFKIPTDQSFRSFRIYSESKYYMLLLGDFLKKKFPSTEFCFIGFNPGIFRSGIYRTQKRWFQRMYKVGAIFMRDPSKVAISVRRVLEKDNLVFNTVYTARGGESLFSPEKPEIAEMFMNKCAEELKAKIRR